jgi:hypothetical protein
MKAKEYGAWPSRNVFSGGQQLSFDEYNREYKKVRYTSAAEYASRNVEEYHHYSEYNDTYFEESEKRRLDDNKSSKNSRSSRMRVFQQVICLVAGSTIVVSTYQAMNNQQQADAMPQPEPPAVVQEVEDNPVPEEPVIPPVASVEWVWDDANKTATARMFDSEGNLIEEVPAEIGITTVDPTCTKEGTKTYTASVERDDQTFTDEKTEALQPLGHSFDNGKDTVLDSGQSAKEFECTRCHEHFTIATSATEND